MELGCAMLAAYAELAEDGKLSMISGDLDTFRIPGQFPATLGLPIYLVVKLLFPPEECDRDYRCRIEILGPQGTVIEATENPLHPPPPPINRKTKVNFLVGFAGLTFHGPGEGAVRILIDGNEVKSLPLYLEQAQAAR